MFSLSRQYIHYGGSYERSPSPAEAASPGERVLLQHWPPSGVFTWCVDHGPGVAISLAYSKIPPHLCSGDHLIQGCWAMLPKHITESLVKSEFSIYKKVRCQGTLSYQWAKQAYVLPIDTLHRKSNYERVRWMRIKKLYNSDGGCSGYSMDRRNSYFTEERISHG